MEDVLVLEAMDHYIVLIEIRKPDKFTLKIVENNQEFKEYLDKDGKAKIYFLGDRVPTERNRLKESQFIDNYSYLLKKIPDAKVFATETKPSDEVKKFYKDHNIKTVDKLSLWDIVKRELP